MKKLQLLLAVHHEFCRAASLPEYALPVSVQSHIERLQDKIMEMCKLNRDEADEIEF